MVSVWGVVILCSVVSFPAPLYSATFLRQPAPIAEAVAFSAVLASSPFDDGVLLADHLTAGSIQSAVRFVNAPQLAA